jgi:hypothetical protein
MLRKSKDEMKIVHMLFVYQPAENDRIGVVRWAIKERERHWVMFLLTGFESKVCQTRCMPRNICVEAESESVDAHKQELHIGRIRGATFGMYCSYTRVMTQRSATGS